MEGLTEPAWLDAGLLPRLAELRAGRGRPTLTTLLSPFDNLIWHRGRMADLWDFHYRIEVYTPAPKRVYGYYTMPILHRGQLVGRLDPVVDRKSRLLTVRKVFWSRASGRAMHWPAPSRGRSGISPGSSARTKCASSRPSRSRSADAEPPRWRVSEA